MKKLICTMLFTLFLNNSVLANETIENTTFPTPTSTKETVIETYTFNGNVLDYENLIPNEIIHNNETYIKKDIKVDEQTKTETLEKIEPVEKIITDKEKENAINLFEKELNYNKDNLTGILKLDESSLNISKNKVENITKYNNKKYTVYEDKTYYGLESNDYSLLPKNIMKDGVVLKLITADFVKTNSVDTYNAVCKYGGTYTKKIPTSQEIVKDYKATVNYVGTVEKTIVENRNVTVFYEKGNSPTFIDTDNNNINDNNIKNENRLIDNQIFILFIIVLIMLFVVTLIIIFVLTRQIKAERRKNFEKNNYKSKKHKYKNKKNEK